MQRVTIEKSAELTHNVGLKLLVAYDTGGPAFESHRSWIFHNTAYLEAKDGQQFPLNGGFDISSQGNGMVGVVYRFEDIPGPLNEYSLVYVAPTLLIEVPVEFDFPAVPVSDATSPPPKQMP